MILSLKARLLASALALGTLATQAHAQDATAPAAPAAEAPAEAAPAISPETVVARVGGAEITEADLDAAAEDLSQQFAQLPPQQRRLATISALIDVKALATKAEAEGLQDEDAVARQIAFLRERALHNAYFDKHGAEAITEDELRARYDAEKERFVPQEEVHARHILVETKEEADKLIERLGAGEKFEDLAREASRDPSAQNGGDLGFFTKGRMVPAFEEAAFALEPGSYTQQPVETQFGWHVIQGVEKRQTQFPPFEQVREQARQVVLRDKYIEMLEAARQDLNVEYVDPELKAQVEALEQGLNQGEMPEGAGQGEAAPQPAQ
ncbi:peptidylprolyl isomerase [Aureimonas altamirensis]|uniref:Parvulin-like PPIase n=1 Tax=Aureimonas altamirensis TaxID=370622 RepID=A0A0B1Q8Y0_9HYPH|nr:peptidylprolyl isomerase [Aureimonas altamirensis]KHJ55270.1 peptidylprolyl isomerase [Aureimonas altamirensis]